MGRTRRLYEEIVARQMASDLASSGRLSTVSGYTSTVGLNIKNERITTLVRELAKRTGMTQTGAIEDAVRHRLADLDEEHSGGGSRGSEAKQASARQLIDELRRSLTAAERTALLGAEANLYDDTGLPA